MATPSPKTPESERTFETAIERLETIVEAMESDKMPLEELLVRYEEGIKLVKVCQEKLESAEKRIEIITRNAAGKPQLTDFEGGGAPATPAAAAPATPRASVPTPPNSPVPPSPPSKPSLGAEDVSLF